MNEELSDCIRAKKDKKVKHSSYHDNGLPKHALQHKHFFDFENPTILEDQVPHYRKRRVLEALDIASCPTVCNSHRQLKGFDPVPWLPLIKGLQSDQNPP
mmetsp:Transcript_34456/g.43515  ORF Transcript_34456/g.43515 Transcript_34456/m.43515 type:complete len:100 (-) Transcript_34456:56-355(-)